MNRTLALTVSPKNRVDKYNKLKWIYMNDSVDIDQLVRKCSKQYQIYPELDISGRLHYHGTIDVHDMIKWHKYTLPKLQLIGYTCVKEIKHDDYYVKNSGKWYEYCTKEWLYTQKILDINKNIYYTKKPQRKYEIIDPDNKLVGYGFTYEEDLEELQLKAHSSASTG